MKLFTKYNRVNLFATIIIFLFTSAAFYVAIRYILISQVDEDLKIEQREIEGYTKEHNALPEFISVKDQKINYNLASDGLKKRKFKTVEGFDPEDKEKNPYRLLQFGVKAGDKLYDVTVAKSL